MHAVSDTEPVDTVMPVDADGTPKDMFGNLQVDIEVAGEDVDEETPTQIKEWTGRSAIYNLVTLAHETNLHVTMKQPEPSAMD